MKTSHRENPPKKADYIIVGGGLAGLQLALSMSEDVFFQEKQILIFEPSAKTVNDKTWCFWEKGLGKWDNILHAQWKKGKFITQEQSRFLEMGNYQYKMIRALDFYNYALKQLSANKNFYLIPKEVKKITGRNCITEEGIFQAGHIFDSRISDKFKAESGNTILQHFKGIIIKSAENVFEKDAFTMMDFRLPYRDLCCFTYVLPLSSSKALVEFTFFSPELLEEEKYDMLIEKYIQKYLKLKKFEILETEKGVIPMSDFKFWKANNQDLTKIGTAGGWVKASSGYSFKNTEKKSRQIIENIKQNKLPSANLINQRYVLYDRILLRILKQKNYLGKSILQQMYFKNKADEIFKFLDEETNLYEDFKLINRFERSPFLWSLSKEFI